MRLKLLTAAALGAALLVVPGTTTRAFESEQSGQTSDWCKDIGRSDDTEQFCEVRELTFGAPKTLSAEVGNGSIAVEGSRRNNVHVLARVVAVAKTEADARALAGQVTIRMDDGRLVADGPRENYPARYWISYRVDTPDRQNLDLEAANGSVSVRGVTGVIRLDTQNGSLRLADLGGQVTARTSNGSLTVDASGSTWSGEGLEATTSNGSMRVMLPSTYNARLVASTNNGSMRVSRPVTVQGRIGKEIDTVLGNGGPTLRLRTSNGSMVIGER